MASKHVDFSIEILGDAGSGFTATVSPQAQKAEHAGFVVWFIDKIPKDFPKKAVIFLQFLEKSLLGKTPVPGPFVGGSATNGRFDARSRVIGGVIKTTGKSCDYGLYYEETAGKPIELLDPELVVEGEAPPLTNFMKARQAALAALLKVIRNKAKGVKTKSTKKKAKPSPKRKAKKR
jgi:hypothetical protein